ncbi:MAG: OmpH family outer membrane protein [Thermodesulfobacteriota bacterium]
MKAKRLVMIVGIILFVGGWFGPVLAAELKIGFVDIQRAVNECNAGKEAKKALTKEMEKFQRLIAEKQKELQTMKDTLDKQDKMLTPESRAAKEKEFQTKLRDFQRWGQDSQNDLTQKQKDLEKNIGTGVQKVVQKIAVDEGYTLILDKNEPMVLFSARSADLTDQVIKILDAQKK